MTKYQYKRLFDKKTKENLGVELQDGTIVVIDNKNKGLRIALPKNKFKSIFKKQMKQKRKYFEFIFNMIEIEAILKSLTYKRRK